MLSKVAFKLSLGLDYVARALWFLLMVLVVGNVISRVFGYPIPGTFELAEFLAALAIGLSLAYCETQDGHVATTFFFDRLGKKGQALANVLIGLFVSVFLGLVVWRMMEYAATIKITGQVAQTTKLSYYPFVYLIAFGFAVYCLVTLGSLLENIKKVVGK